MNTGKQFEADFKNSVPENCWYYRFRDGTATFYGGQAQDGVRFQQTNIADCIIVRRALHLFELKSVQGMRLPFDNIVGKYDTAKGRYRRQKQLEDMRDASEHPEIHAWVVVNFRGEHGGTWCAAAADVLYFIQHAPNGCKSIPCGWFDQHGMALDARKLKVNYRYDIDGLLRRMEAQKNA